MLCVDPARVAEMWPHVEGLIGKATRHGDYDTDVIRRDLLSGLSLLWISWDEAKHRIVACATTTLIKTRRGLVCLLTACAGENILEWYDKGMAIIEAYAKAEGCIAVRVNGRLGWRRWLRQRGVWTEPYVTLEKRMT
jgi:hypothetical protein